MRETVTIRNGFVALGHFPSNRSNVVSEPSTACLSGQARRASFPGLQGWRMAVLFRTLVVQARPTYTTDDLK